MTFAEHVGKGARKALAAVSAAALASMIGVSAMSSEAYAGYYTGTPGYDQDNYYWLEECFCNHNGGYMTIRFLYGVYDGNDPESVRESIDYDATLTGDYFADRLDSAFTASESKEDFANEFEKEFGYKFATGATFGIWDYNDVKNVETDEELPEPLNVAQVQQDIQTGITYFDFTVPQTGSTYVIMQLSAPDGYDYVTTGEWYQFIPYQNGIRFDCNNKNYGGDEVITGKQPIWVNTKSDESSDEGVAAYSLALEQTFASPSLANAKAGDIVTINYKVTNNYPFAVKDLAVKTSLGIDVALEKTELEPAESTTGVAEYAITEADIAAGTINSVASAEAVAVGGNGEVSSGDVITSGDVETGLTIEGVADGLVEEGQSGEQGGSAASAAEQVSGGQRLSQTGDAGIGIASAAIAAAALAGVGAVAMARRKQD